MGLDDRDYMRERNRRTFDRMVGSGPRAPEASKPGPSLLFMAGCWICFAFLLYKGYGWWLEKKANRPSSVVQEARHAHDQPVVPRQLVPEEGTVRLPVPVQRPAYSPLTLNVPGPNANVRRAPQPAPAEAAPSRTGGTVYLCKRDGGGSFWSSGNCNQDGAVIDRIVSVPEGLPFDEQVRIAEERRRVLTSTSTTPGYSYSTPAAMPAPASNSKPLCESLDARVAHLDSMARQPQSGEMQDWIRSERQKTRDEQFRLRC